MGCVKCGRVAGRRHAARVEVLPVGRAVLRAQALALVVVLQRARDRVNVLDEHNFHSIGPNPAPNSGL